VKYPKGLLWRIALDLGMELKGKGTKRQVRCRDHDDKAASAVIFEDNRYHCSVCTPQGALSLLEFCEKHGVDLSRYTSWTAGSEAPSSKPTKAQAPVLSAGELEAVMLQAVKRAQDPACAKADRLPHEYLAKRGLTQAVAQGAVGVLHESMDLPPVLRFWLRKGYRIVCAVYDQHGKFSTIQGRNVIGGEPKTMFLKGSKVSGCMFADERGRKVLAGTDTTSDTVILAEGLTDFLALSFTSPVPVLSAPGTSMAVKAVGMWAKGRTVIVAVDHDEAGDQARLYVMAQALEYEATVAHGMYWPGMHKDACDVLDAMGADGLRLFLEEVVAGKAATEVDVMRQTGGVVTVPLAEYLNYGKEPKVEPQPPAAQPEPAPVAVKDVPVAPEAKVESPAPWRPSIPNTPPVTPTLSRDARDPEGTTGALSPQALSALPRVQPPTPSRGSSGGPHPLLANSWADPKPLKADLPPVKAFDLDLIPESCRAWVEDIALRVQCPVDYLAVSLMISLGALLGRRIGIRPKRHDNWLVVANLWGAIIGRPGFLKSPAVREILKPLRRLEADQDKAFYEALQAHNKQLELVEERKKVSRRQYRQAVDKHGEDSQEAKSIGEAISVDLPDMPVCRRYIVNDATVEALGEILSKNPNGVLVFRDELTGFLYGLERDGQESARAFYLEAWNGTDGFTYDRISRGTVRIDSAIVSIIGCIQPGPLMAYLAGTVGQNRGDDGFIQRFQLAVWPDPSPDWVDIDRWPDVAAKNRAYAVFQTIESLTPESVGAETDKMDPDGIPFLRFSEDGQQLFNDYRGPLERQVRSGEESAAIESHLAKFRSLVPSLALILHVANDGSGPVPEGCVRDAIAWAGYLESHARRIYASASNPVMATAKALSKKILDGSLGSQFKLHDAYKNDWSGLTDRDAVLQAAQLLVDLEWLTEKKEKTEGAPKTTYLVNPKLQAKFGGKAKAPSNAETPDDDDGDWGTA